MLQSMLADRFRLKAHFEKRSLQVYELTVARSGPKLQSAARQGDVPVAPPSPEEFEKRLRTGAMPPPGAISTTTGQLLASAMPMERFVRFLSVTVQRPVIDKTALAGSYDIRLQWAPGLGERGPFGDIDGATASARSDAPSLFIALQEQLGLRLEAAPGPVDVLVIDSVAQPAAN